MNAHKQARVSGTLTGEDSLTDYALLSRDNIHNIDFNEL